ncbi:MAG: ArsC/Spx/MgsR family protein [Myxococcota bacterium]|nr:arsenate reductase (glutaredoxin) [Myxococcales bacterium]
MPLPARDDELQLLHNPRCSKSRAAKELLESRGVAFAVRLYLEEPLSRAELDDLEGRLGRPPGEWVRTKDEAFRVSGLSPASEPGAIKDAIARAPALLERPILVRGRRAVVGRPTEDLLALLP